MIDIRDLMDLATLNTDEHDENVSVTVPIELWRQMALAATEVYGRLKGSRSANEVIKVALQEAVRRLKDEHNSATLGSREWAYLHDHGGCTTCEFIKEFQL